MSAADASVIARDPALPGLATVLDPEAFVAALGRSLPDADVEAARISYVKYKPGTNCLVGYRLDVNDGTVDVYVKAYTVDDARDQLRRARNKSGVPGPLGPGRIALEDCAAVVSVFPNDRKVTTLVGLVDASARQRVFRELVPDRPELWGGAVQRLVYKPERRYVGRVVAGNAPCAALKVYTEAEYSAARRNAQAFQSSGPLRIVPQLGRLDSHRMLAFAWVPDHPLSNSIADPGLDLNAVATAGAALAALHAQDPDGLAHRTREAEASALHVEATWLARVCPPLAARAADLAQRLTRNLLEEPAADRPIHGDLHARQVLLGGTTATILDLDAAVRADPAADLGNCIAHLEREVARGTLTCGRLEAVSGALLDGYRAATRRPLPVRIELYTAVGLFRLAPRFFRYWEPDWPKRTETALERARAILEGIPTRATGSDRLARYAGRIER